MENTPSVAKPMEPMEIAKASGGYSSPPIYRLIQRYATDFPESARVLDFGAGVGWLIRLLGKSPRALQLTGADLLPQPAELPNIPWLQGNLNEPLDLPDGSFDAIVAAEVIGYLENTRAIFREFHRLLRPGGTLIVTMPNQESLRSYASLVMAGHFTAFTGNHPGYITAPLRMDLERICAATDFAPPRFDYTNQGGLPKLPRFTWQQASLGLLRGRLFSDNLLMITTR